MNFAEYYAEAFRHDLQRVFAEGWCAHANDPNGPVIQPRTLSVENPVIIELSDERRVHFATALYFTILVDTIMLIHFPCVYAPFRALTRYPQFRADCPGGCSARLYPEQVFDVLARPCGKAVEDWRLMYRSSLGEAIPVMRSELLSFVRVHLPTIKGEEVWGRCLVAPALSWSLG